jgi:dienelactone hydrolase
MKSNHRAGQIVTLTALFLFLATVVYGQKNPVYENLPVGIYTVGFKIFTLTDDSRIVKPEYNYLGEKNEGDRRKKITIHLWYPAITNSGKKNLRFEDYCYNNLLTSTNDIISKEQRDGQINGRRRSVEGWFGKTTDDAWTKLLEASMLAVADAEQVKQKLPLLIGMLRPLSTSFTNEMLASNGYVVAMLQQANFSSFAQSTLEAIPDMRFAIAFLEKNANIDKDKIGTYGFSGSGFSQVLFAMNDYRIKAVADIESGIYMDNLFQNFSSSNYYIPSKLRAPFLHIFSRDLSKQEKFINEFEAKTKFANRYRLLLNQPALHHWDFAAEGYSASIFLNNRGEQKNNIRQSFEIASVYLLNFFDAELKKDAKATTFLSGRPGLKQTQDSLWDISVLNAVKPAPDREEFEYIIRTKGIDQATAIVKNAVKEDTLSNIMQWFNLNGLGYTFLNERKFNEAIEVFKLNTELHPGDANLFDSLAEGYELSGDKENMKKVSGIVMEILNKKDNLSDAEKGLKENAQKRLK